MFIEKKWILQRTNHGDIMLHQPCFPNTLELLLFLRLILVDY